MRILISYSCSVYLESYLHVLYISKSYQVITLLCTKWKTYSSRIPPNPFHRKGVLRVTKDQQWKHERNIESMSKMQTMGHQERSEGNMIPYLCQKNTAIELNESRITVNRSESRSRKCKHQLVLQCANMMFMCSLFFKRNMHPHVRQVSLQHGSNLICMQRSPCWLSLYLPAVWSSLAELDRHGHAMAAMNNTGSTSCSKNNSMCC